MMTVADGYNGSTVDLDMTVLDETANAVKLSVVGKPWLIRWVDRKEYERAEWQQWQDERPVQIAG